MDTIVPARLPPWRRRPCYREGVQVVLTRDADDGQPFARALGPHVIPVFMPVTSVAPAGPDDQARLAAAAAARATYAHLFVASRHAIAPLVAALAAAGGRPADAPPAIAVGPATTAALSAAGFAATSLGDTGDAAAAALIARGVAGRRILAPRAAGGRDAPLDALRAAGAEVDAIVAYRTAAAAAADPAVAAGRAALAGGHAAACLVFAPSQVAALADVLAADGGLAVLAATRVVAIGPTTADALRARGVTVAATAASPTPAAMAAAVAAAIS